MKGILLLIGGLCFGVLLENFKVNGHGRLMDPPNRSSIWRLPEFEYLDPPTNYDDDMLYCGGGLLQDEKNGCGVCGDDINEAVPRANEDGGTYGRGILVRNYTDGQVIPIEVELTKSHRGHFEFRLCSRDVSSETENQDCFDKNVLQLADGSGTKLPIPAPNGIYKTRVQLPKGVTCKRCVIQWNYKTGNTWGDCGDGTFEVGCGPQETFRGCADVTIISG